MLEIPAPMITALPLSRGMVRRRPLVICRENPDVMIAIASDTRVVGTLYASGIGNEKASMPMKCMDQMPTPMATAPIPTHIRAP